MDYPELILISIIAMMIATVIGVCLVMYGYGISVERVHAEDQSETTTGKRRICCLSTKQKSGKVKKIEEWFKDPYNLVPNTYMKWMFGVLFILNCFNVFELYKLYIMDDINAAFECTFQDGLVYGFDKQCVVYFELM